MPRNEINTRIREVLNHQPSEPNNFGIPGDDLGTADLTYLGFKIFGPEIESIDKVIGLLFLFSIIIFWISYFNRKHAFIIIIR